MILEIGPPPDVEFVIGSNAGAAIISPDGSTVAFLGQTPAGRKLFVRSLATGETRAITGAVEASYPFWSPDSRSLGFFSSTQLMTVAIAGGLPEAVAPIETGRGGSWSDSGVLLFTPKGGGVIHRVPERGGTVERITTLDASRGENAHYFPVALPGGKQFLFFVRSSRAENNGIYLGYLDGKTQPVRLVTSLSSGRHSTGRPTDRRRTKACPAVALAKAGQRLEQRHYRLGIGAGRRFRVRVVRPHGTPARCPTDRVRQSRPAAAIARRQKTCLHARVVRNG